MKTLPRIDETKAQPTPGKLYLGAIRPMRTVADGCPDRDEVHYYGPLGGLQLTYNLLRDPADGEHFGFYDQDLNLWRIGGCYYSDICVIVP